MRYTNARNARMTDPSTVFRIERSAVPMPAQERGRCTVYPFDQMRPGDSFLINDRRTRWKVARAALGYSKRHAGYKFVIKRVLNGRWRCWRA